MSGFGGDPDPAPGLAPGRQPEARPEPIAGSRQPSTEAVAASPGADDTFIVAARPDPWAHRRGEPRTFAALWIVLLFMAAVVSIGSAGATGLVSIDVYRAGARIMLCVIGAGLGLIWPMVRLSQETPQSPARAMFQDVFVITAPLQAMTWPQCLPWMAAFPVGPIAAISAAYFAWTLLLAGLLALMLQWASRAPAASRTGMMAIIAGLSLTGPAIGLLTHRPSLDPQPGVNGWLLASPLTCGWEIVGDRSWTGMAALARPEHWWSVGAVGTVAGFVWVWVASLRRPA
ncbi:MAG: hypothetical protein GC200_04450 [Tepidisphaera sp.]|nr:hypothetical protein [Tepidisphaera sp.]